MTCWPPVVTSMSSGSTSMPSAAITVTMASPHGGHALRRRVLQRAGASRRRRSCESSAASDSAGKVDVSGRPPASEMTSGRSVMAMRSRMAEDFMTEVREAKSPA